MRTFLLICACVSFATVTLAQTATPTQESPQRQKSPAIAAPHRTQVTDGKKKMHGERQAQIRECTAKEQAADNSLGKDEARKTCRSRPKTK